MTTKLIKSNLDTISANVIVGIVGIFAYPSIHIFTSYPIGPYAIICYSVHHLHILTCLRNIATILNKYKFRLKKSSNKKFINYNFFNESYSIDEKRKSIYSLNIEDLSNNCFSSNNNFWYTKVIPQSTFSYDCQLAIYEIVSHRDFTTKTIIGINLLGICASYILNSSIFLPGYIMSIMYFLTFRKMFDGRIDIIKKELPKDKKYFYINTFGDIVPTNYKFGLYFRYKLSE